MKRVFCLLATCALLFSCVKEEVEEPKPHHFGDTPYTLNVTAVRGGRPESKALSYDGIQLTSSWAVGEKVRVYKGDVAMGVLQAQTAGVSTTLSGTVTKVPEVGDELRLEFLSPDYEHQQGTLDYISAHCDYATASVTVSSVEEPTITTSDALFQSMQAVVALQLLDASNSILTLSATSLDVTVDDKTITVTPETPANMLYLAVPAFSDKPVTLKASVGDKLYSLYKHSVSLEAAGYYTLKEKLSPSILVHDENELKAAVEANQAMILFANDIKINKFVQVVGGKTVSIDLCGFTLDRGCIARGSQTIIVESGGTLNLMNGTVTGGWGGDGGALLNKGTANLTDVSVEGNHSDNRAGGICNNSGATLTMTGGSITGNTCNDVKVHEDDTAGGGGLFNHYGATATLTGVTVSGNVATVHGGGGICNYGKLTLNGCTVTGNQAHQNGGGIWNGIIEGGKNPALTINGCSITGNRAGNCGGGIYAGNDIGNKNHDILSMQGAITVTGNATVGGVADNVYLKYRKYIKVIGSLAGSTIGITLETTPHEFTKNFSTYNSVDPDSIFKPDMAGVMSIVSSPNKEAYQVKAVPENATYYIERAWDPARKEVTATVKFLTEQIAADATPTSETQYKVLPASGSLNIGTEGSKIHEFYVVKDKVDIKSLVLVGPHVHIILSDNAEFILGEEIVVTQGHTVYIHDQGSEVDMGKLHGGHEDYMSSASLGGSISDVKYGGNIEIHGGNINLRAKDASAIGGHYNTQIGEISIFGGKIKAEGAEGSAGIGGGSMGSNYGTINIYGGTIQAIGGDDQDDPEPGGGAGIGGGFECKGGTLHIFGGDITASTVSESAGIGCGQNAGSKGAGTIIIDGGTVRAYGGKYGAGIGGGDGIDGGDVTINGGHVEAYGGTDAAGIGGGEGGNGGTVTITGGYVYAEGGWEYGAGIGGGQDGRGAKVTITGGTVVAQAGLNETGCRAIGPGEGCDDYGSLTLGDNMMVSSERMANEVERKNMCWYRTRVRVEPCTHPGHTAADCPYHKH